MSDMCDFYSFKSALFGGDYYCNIKEGTVNSDTYSRYCKGYNYSNCPIYKKHNSSSGFCFITTIVCRCLNKGDDDVVLKNMRSLRDDVMQKDERYYDLLKMYDTIGPVIGGHIYTDREIAKDLYDNVLTDVSNLIENKNYELAIKTYYYMVMYLVNYYEKDNFYNEKYEKNFGYENGEFCAEVSGHGRKRIRVNNKLW